MRTGRLVLAALVGVACALAFGVFFLPTAPPPEAVMRERVAAWQPKIQAAAQRRGEPPKDPNETGPTEADATQHPQHPLGPRPALGPPPEDGKERARWARDASQYELWTRVQVTRDCGADQACQAVGLWRHADEAAYDELASRLRRTAIELAKSSGDVELWRDMKAVDGTGLYERRTERRMVQAWGRLLADRAPAMQRQIIEAAVRVTPDSPLHEPLAILGGYPACSVDHDLGWVACAPHR